ncbi:hypothetical protein KC325_g242 [Hortaea werneckii]|nr:hypothetical protein KC325_g242 [Hortaea werneckii]
MPHTFVPSLSFFFPFSLLLSHLKTTAVTGIPITLLDRDAVPNSPQTQEAFLGPRPTSFPFGFTALSAPHGQKKPRINHSYQPTTRWAGDFPPHWEANPTTFARRLHTRSSSRALTPHLVIGRSARGVCRLVVPVRVYASALRLSIIASMGAVRHVVAMAAVVDLVVVAVIGRDGGGARLVARSEILVAACGEGVRRHAGTVEVALAEARSVVVAGAGAVAFLFLVVAHEGDLHGGRAEEEEGANDGDGEDGCVELARGAEADGVGDVLAFAAAGAKAALSEAAGAAVGGAVAERGLHVAGAAARAVAGEYGDGDHASDEADVQDDGDEGEEGDAAEAAGEAYGADGVQGRDTGEAFNCAFPLFDLCGMLVSRLL